MASSTVVRAGRGERSGGRFEYTPNLQLAAKKSLTLHQGSSIEVVSEIVPFLLSDYYVVVPEQLFQPLTFLSPFFRIPYPNDPGQYLRVLALGAFPDPIGAARPSLAIVIDLTASQLPDIKREPPTISRIGLLGNLLFHPGYDQRGPVHNFGIPRAIRVYAVNWNKPFNLQNLPPHPRSWKLMYEDTDVRGLWGWTYLDFPPTRTSHILMMFSHLPILPDEIDPETAKLLDAQGNPWDFRGVAIERLAVHEYECAVEETKTAAYVPVASWASHYEPDPPFRSLYWEGRGVGPALLAASKYQSIYREVFPPGFPSNTAGFDLQPSALVGLPFQVNLPSETVPDAEATADGYLYRSYYSADVIYSDRSVRTSLVVQVADTQPPSIYGARLRMPAVMRPQQTITQLPEAYCWVYKTDDPRVAFSFNPDRDDWEIITQTVFDFSAENADSLFNFLYGQKIIFPYDCHARFYRFEFRFYPSTPFTGPKRFELAELVLLRSPHPTVVAAPNEIVKVDEVHIRLTGRNLLDDYAYINGKEIMDLQLQLGVRDEPYRELIQLRSLLDVREKTGVQIIACQRATRSRVQVFREEQYPNAHRSLSVTLQNMLRGGETELNQLQNHQLVDILPDASGIPVGIPNLQGFSRNVIGLLLGRIQGVTTDRNLEYGEVLGLVRLLEASGVPAQDILKMMNVFANSSFNDLVGVSGDLIAGALEAGLAPLRELLDTIADFFDIGEEDPPRKTVLFNHSQLSNGPVPLIAAFNGLPTDAPKSELRKLNYRPSLSYSGSIGAQFIAGGSLGVSGQLDAGKSTSLSWGTQGQANETLLVNDHAFRRSKREEELDKAVSYDWKGEEVKRAGEAMDILTIRIPAGVTLSPPTDEFERPDSLRVRVNLLPPGVKLEVRFIGQRRFLDKPSP